MNYIKELNAFRDWLLLTDVSTSAIALWHALMMINNSAGWKCRFNAPNSVVQQLTGLSKQGVANARAQLLEHEMIKYEKGKRGKAPVYQMVSLVHSVDLSVDRSLYQSSDHLDDQFNDQSNTDQLTVLKQKYKQKRRRRPRADDHLLTVYEQHFGSVGPFVEEALEAWCADFSEEVVIAAMKLAVKYGGRTLSYIEQILKEWAKQGLATIDDVTAYEAAKQTKRHNTIPFRERARQGGNALFDELRQGGTCS
ncbi:DnaD domain-containing protein [Lentibacillus saliphilus]|uniref:DnaD domain-containing protein n=1 Tax=Lentibacillus saliphilus TaxID=2737028 RepID=UPI001C30A6E0|nr:DnaD domain protein [Lentibacillus saliphilus]